MDFQLTEEQQMLKDSARRFLEENCVFEQRQRLIDKGSFDTTRWNVVAELGWLGMSLPEQYGGLGGSAIETAILMEEMGRVLFVEPYWAVGVLAAQTILASGDAARASEILPLIAAGEARPVLAHGEAEAHGVLEFVATQAKSAGPGSWRLSGNKTLVVGGNVADRLIVSARTSGSISDRHGITLFLIDRNAPGVQIRDLRLIDNRWAADIQLSDVSVSRANVLGEVDQAWNALDEGYAHALVGLCAESIGMMEKALWITRDYLKIRKQFGTTLSTFQTLQHRMSEMLIEVELARGMLHKALSAMSAPAEERRRALSVAKVHVGRSGTFVCGQAIQLHGGIGVTEEYVIGHYYKRMTTIENALGTSHFHLQQLAETLRAEAA